MSVRKITATALFCALIALLSQLVLPLPGGVPVTLQVLGVALCGCCLGYKMGTVAVAVYLLLGGCGLPVFSAFGSGIGWLLGPTGGFLWGFLPLCLCCGLPIKKRCIRVAVILAGLLVCHLMGVAQYALVTHTSLLQAMMAASLPYLLKDMALVLGAGWVARQIRRRL